MILNPQACFIMSAAPSKQLAAWTGYHIIHTHHNEMRNTKDPNYVKLPQLPRSWLAFARLFTWLAFPSTITKSKRGGSQACAFNSTIPLSLAPLQSSCNLMLTLWILGMLFCGIWYRNSWEQFYTEKDTHTTKIYQKKIQSANRVRNTVTTNASNSCIWG